MRPAVPAGPVGPDGTDGTRAARTTGVRPSRDAARDDVLASALRRAVEATSAYGGTIYLRSPDRNTLLLSSVAGIPLPVLSAFRRLPVSGPLPASVAFRTGRTICLADADETMRRFPRLAVGLPYAFASAFAPVADHDQVFGVLSVLWPSSEAGLPPGARRHLRAAANRLAGALAQLAAAGHPTEETGPPAVVQLPNPAGPAIRVGLFDWDVATGAFTADESLCAILGITAADFDGRAATLNALVAPEDVPRVRAAARAAVQDGKVLACTLRVRDGHGRYRPVELWGRSPEGAAPSHLVGAVLDTTLGSSAVAAVERLRDGVFSLEPDGRLGYANRSLEILLGVSRDQLIGHHPWDVLPWLADPAYEDRYRAATLSQQPTAFLACRPPDQWLAFSLYPDAHGVTGRVVSAAPPRTRPDTPVTPAPTVRPSPGAVYHLLQLTSALTEAVTANEVFDAVADQILPGFGGQEIAIYLIRSGRMHLCAQRGYPEGFLDPFEGTSMRARLPGVEALSSGAPIFFSSGHELLASYPGIPRDEMDAWAFLPLIASGRPVGSCIIGWDEPRTFSVEERSVLTGLGGLIAQALERARLFDAEYAVARGLQQALLPHRLPEVPGLTITARYLPGTEGMEIGGDWYDVITTAQGPCLVIGDVEGHSVGAAATMGQLRSAVRAFVVGGGQPGEVLARTNQLLVDLDPGLLASCCLFRLDTGTGHAQAARAGHLPPLLRHADGHTEILDLAGGALLGVDRSSGYPVSEVELPPGSVLALYTDGLVEQPGEEIDQGIDRLRASLAHAAADSLDDLADRLVRAAGRSAHRADDVALLLTARVRTARGVGT